MNMNNPITFALDVPSDTEANNWCARLEEHVGAFKVGLELFIASGRLPATKRPVILDLKLHDIPETVERAVKAGGDRGAKFMTIHIQQRKALEMAVKAAEPFGITLLGVTVLTSMTLEDFRDLNYADSDIEYRVIRAARFGASCGLKGFVCSPQEVKALRSRFSEAFLLVPGVRPAGAALGDQKRVGTPSQAIQDGASFIVVGRPIRDAQDPVKAAQAILREITN